MLTIEFPAGADDFRARAKQLADDMDILREDYGLSSLELEVFASEGRPPRKIAHRCRPSATRAFDMMPDVDLSDV